MANKFVKNETINFKTRFDFLHVFKSVAVSYLVSLVLLMLCSFIFTLSSMSDGVMKAFVTCVTGISIMVAGFIASRKTKTQGWLSGSLAGLIYLAVLYLVGSLVLNDFVLSKNVGIMLLLSFVCGAVGGIIGVNVGRKRRK